MRTRSMLLILLALLFLLGTACGDAGPVSADPAPAASPDVVDIVSDTVVTMPTQQPSSVPTQAPTPEPIMVAGAAVQNGTLCAVVKADDFASIEQIEGLVTLDVSGSDCYDAILRYRDAHPEVKVLYTVPIGGVSIPSEAQSASVPRVPDPSLLHYLPNLTALSVTEPMAPDTAKALLSALPDATLDYAVSFAGMTVSSSETALDLSGVSPEKAAALTEGIAALPNLVDINLNRKNGSSAWKLKDAGVLQAVRPSLRVDLNITAFGVSFSLTDDVVSFSGIPMNKKKNELTALLPYLRNVGRLDMENCRLSNEEMAELRAAFPSPKIVWRVNVGKYSCRTDAIMIRFSVHSAEMTLHQSDVKGLMYCNEVKYLDLGHNAFNDPYFIAYMPNLEVCILAAGKTEDLSALANCPNLEYLELFTCRFTDISPLANCKNLRHLNLCNSMITDITPLYGLTELERLWISASHVPPEQIERFRELVPTCLVNDTAEDPTTEWRFDPNRESTYTERYELLRKQFCYGTNITSYSEPPVLD